MLDFLGDTGGLFEIVGLIIYFFISLIVERSFRAAIISDAYKIQKYSRDQSEYYISETAHNNRYEHSLSSESESVSDLDIASIKQFNSDPEDKERGASKYFDDSS